MKAGKLEKLVTAQTDGWSTESGRWSTLMRLAAMQGIELPEFGKYINSTPTQEENREIEIPMEAAAKILALDYAERATSDMRAMGEGMAKVSVSVPSNINVWSHTKGANAMIDAAQKLTQAAKAITEKASRKN